MASDERDTGHGLTARGAATRARIVEAAADLVGERGVGNTSLDDVMGAAAVSKSQLYHYFADKDALVRAVIALQTSRVLDLQRTYLLPVDSLAALFQWREAIVAINSARRGRGGCPVGSLANELADRSEEARSVLVDSFESWQGLICNALQAVASPCTSLRATDAYELAMAVLAAIQGGLLMAKTTRTTRPLELALDMALDHVTRRLTMVENAQGLG